MASMPEPLPGDVEMICPAKFCLWQGIVRECVQPLDDVIRCPHCETPVEIKPKD